MPSRPKPGDAPHLKSHQQSKQCIHKSEHCIDGGAHGFPFSPVALLSPVRSDVVGMPGGWFALLPACTLDESNSRRSNSTGTTGTDPSGTGAGKTGGAHDERSGRLGHRYQRYGRGRSRAGHDRNRHRIRPRRVQERARRRHDQARRHRYYHRKRRDEYRLRWIRYGRWRLGQRHRGRRPRNRHGWRRSRHGNAGRGQRRARRIPTSRHAARRGKNPRHRIHAARRRQMDRHEPKRTAGHCLSNDGRIRAEHWLHVRQAPARCAEHGGLGFQHRDVRRKGRPRLSQRRLSRRGQARLASAARGVRRGQGVLPILRRQRIGVSGRRL